jgi:hypothetical protein
METTMAAIVVAAQGYGITERTKTCVGASPKATARPFRTMAHDFASRRCRSRRPRLKTCGIQSAISMSQMADRSAPSNASLVKGDGDSFALIWSRRNGDLSNRIDAPHLFGSEVNGR